MPTELTLIPEVRGPLSVYPIASARDHGIDAFVTDRFGGVSFGSYDSLNLGLHVGDRADHVMENRQRVGDAIGVSVDHLVIVRQVHGHDDVSADDARPDTCADAMHTDRSDLALAILVADCLPVLLYDQASPRLAVVHAGWRGLDARVLTHALEGFPDPARVHAFIGPSISPEAYQVGSEVAERFETVAGALRPDADSRWRLDLRRVAQDQLLGLGVSGSHITACTQTTDGGETFFSDRAKRPCGRFALVARRVVA